ncbi:hypothetical protein CH305_19320 [Rhodococcus sp. 15-649-2-2]|nr:hypothetical protein CH305_19320 [Rhodococcus sp. 15-649-2-2]
MGERNPRPILRAGIFVVRVGGTRVSVGYQIVTLLAVYRLNESIRPMPVLSVVRDILNERSGRLNSAIKNRIGRF